ncbi:MAG TPA: endonuclease/exonuclease/phosphatase family protein [Micromonosporaceae bacterium]|nr:endonuclease/exonuclease/phosphatase family protein [Micromonosporaceae bacterium]
MDDGPAEPEPAAAGPVTLRVMSYNVHGQRDDRGALASVVRDIAPDIVVVQEAPRRFRWRARSAELARGWRMLYAAGGLPSLGNLIVTTHRVRVRDSWCLRYPLTPGRHLRGAVFARCTVGAATFVVAGTHLATDDVERVGQARIFADECATVTEPLLVAADLNDTAGGASWSILVHRLVDPAATLGKDGLATFPAGAPTRRIDAVFVDPRCSIEAYDVVATPAARAASDHLPVVVDVRVPT